MTAKTQIANSMSESDLQSAVIELARLKGWRCFHARASLNQRGKWATHATGDPGYPDLTLARNGEVLFLELKTQRGRVRAEQEAWIDALGAFVIRPEQWANGTVEDLLA